MTQAGTATFPDGTAYFLHRCHPIYHLARAVVTLMRRRKINVAGCNAAMPRAIYQNGMSSSSSLFMTGAGLPWAEGALLRAGRVKPAPET